MGEYLDVSSSLTGRVWRGPTSEETRAAQALAQSAQIDPALARVLARRGVGAAQVPAFLDPKLRDLMPDPRGLKDMDRAAERLIRALTGERVAIFVDYDVDGGACAALLLDYLGALGQTATLYVPDRTLEGYGPNAPAMAKLAAAHDLIVCVDCGTLSHDAIAAANGADVIVLDHHLGGATLPPALAVVNPNRQDETGDCADLCAAGVTFMTLVEVNRLRREAGQPAPDLMAMLDLVALATVADVAPLVGLNRAFVRQGLAVMARRARPGLVALADQARLTTAPTAYHLGYVLGPRINAGGRIGRADLGARLLASTNPDEAAAMAEKLGQLNDERRTIEAGVRDAALAQVEDRGAPGALAWAAGDGWHAGVVGIVAARLKAATNRPSVVIGFDGDDGKGSGRSVTGIDLGAAIHRLVGEGLIEKGGGHAMAAGLSLSRAQLAPAMARLTDLLARQGAGQLGPSELVLDGVLMPPAATPELIALLETAGPYGAAAPAPRFVFPDQPILHARRVGEAHLKVSFGEAGHRDDRLDAIAFGAFDGPLGPAIEAHKGARFHLAGRLELNHWQGRTTAQLRLEDAAAADAETAE